MCHCWCFVSRIADRDGHLVQKKSIFDVLPTDVMFEVISAMPAEDVSKLVSTCSAAAAAFTTDKMWFYDWLVRYWSYEHALVAAIKRHEPAIFRRLLGKAPKG